MGGGGGFFKALLSRLSQSSQLLTLALFVLWLRFNLGLQQARLKGRHPPPTRAITLQPRPWVPASLFPSRGGHLQGARGLCVCAGKRRGTEVTRCWQYSDPGDPAPLLPALWASPLHNSPTYQPWQGQPESLQDAGFSFSEAQTCQGAFGARWFAARPAGEILRLQGRATSQ